MISYYMIVKNLMLKKNKLVFYLIKILSVLYVEHTKYLLINDKRNFKL